MLSRLLRQFLFTLIHLVVSLLVAVKNVYHRYWVKRSSSYKDEVTKSDIQMILEHVPRVNKKLKHLVLIADSEQQSLSELARLVVWSLVAGVPYVSLHDITGDLKANEEKLFLEVERNKKGIPGCIKWSNKPNLNGYTNGIPAHTIMVNILSPEDGRTRIAQCIQEIARGKIPCQRNSNEFTAQELDEALTLMYPPIPDPDLVLYTGPLCCTHGLLPWQIRLTEFIQLSVDHSINIENYIGALTIYSKCDQRFGK
ncbi:dehydrodolichyl diphosphate synthase complex subunit NUS1 [Pectinophora gossypiella]|uniref:dehydrodolichyl diphosphate synthase complex subunit NUS1 n=1 Tax=Pectinophora gossypiella TaxID=13191 RepID=UPI00214E2349|nr:dehydrodolichyl diphosphate synthase complex subunit NUS1 [Pectinophora gossypiella]